MPLPTLRADLSRKRARCASGLAHGATIAEIMEVLQLTAADIGSNVARALRIRDSAKGGAGDTAKVQ